MLVQPIADLWWLKLEDWDSGSITVQVWSSADRSQVSSDRAGEWGASGITINGFTVADRLIQKLGPDLAYLIDFPGAAVHRFDSLFVSGWNQGRRGLDGTWCAPAKIFIK